LQRTPTWRLRLKLGRPSSSCSSSRGRCRRGLPGPPRPRKQQLPAVVLRYASTRARYGTVRYEAAAKLTAGRWRGIAGAIDDQLVWLCPLNSFSFPGGRGQWRGAGGAVGAGGPDHRRQLQRRRRDHQPAGVRLRRGRLRRVTDECMRITLVLPLLLSACTLSPLSLRICPFSCRYWDSVWNYPGSGLPGQYNT
jgi:hypothetical protein